MTQLRPNRPHSAVTGFGWENRRKRGRGPRLGWGCLAHGQLLGGQVGDITDRETGEGATPQTNTRHKSWPFGPRPLRSGLPQITSGARGPREAQGRSGLPGGTPGVGGALHELCPPRPAGQTAGPAWCHQVAPGPPQQPEVIHQEGKRGPGASGRRFQPRRSPGKTPPCSRLPCRNPTLSSVLWVFVHLKTCQIADRGAIYFLINVIYVLGALSRRAG